MVLRRRSIVALTALIVLLMAPAGASARRHATETELGEMSYWSYVPSPCELAYISTVDSHWASWTPRTHGRCAPFAANGVTVLKRSGKRWHQVTAGSSFTCPVPRVPAAIVDDLRIPCG